MLRIILCDDEPFLLKLEAEKVKEQIKKSRLEAEIVCVAGEGQEMLRFLKKNQGDYLFFMDLDFGEGKLNGIDLAKQVKQLSPFSKIVFVTNHRQMAMDVLGSGVEPFGFLEKTTDMNQLGMGYRKYIQMAVAAVRTTEESDVLHLHIAIDEEVALKITQVAYVEAEKSISHGLSYVTLDGSRITVRDSMEHVQEMLGEGFLRSHRSVLVNKKFMVGLSEGMIKLCSGEEVPCSFRMKSEVKKWIS